MLNELLMVAASLSEPQYEQQYERRDTRIEHRQPAENLAWQCHLVGQAWRCKWELYNAEHDAYVRRQDRYENDRYERNRARADDDRDGIPNYRDSDDDNDGIPDYREHGRNGHGHWRWDGNHRTWIYNETREHRR